MTSLSRIIFIIFVVLSIGMFAYFNYNQYSKTTMEIENKPVTFLALGDSYTIGESVEYLERWPIQLRRALIASKKLTIDSVQIIAKTGWTTDELNVGIDAEQIDGTTYDWVSLSIGVNNQYRGKDTTEYRVELRALIDRALAFADQKKERLFLVNIPDWGVTPFAKKMDRDEQQVGIQIDAFNQIMREEADLAGLAYVDINEISKGAKFDPSLIAEDGLHPSGKMYALWVVEIIKYIDFIR